MNAAHLPHLQLESTRSVSGRTPSPSSVEKAESPLRWDSSPCLTEVINRLVSLLCPSRKPLGEIIPVQPMSAGRRALYNSPIGDRHNGPGRFWLELVPSLHVLLRPEEIHPNSAVRPWFGGGLIVMDDGAFRHTQQDFAVAHLHSDGLVTIRAYGVYPDKPAWK